MSNSETPRSASGMSGFLQVQTENLTNFASDIRRASFSKRPSVSSASVGSVQELLARHTHGFKKIAEHSASMNSEFSQWGSLRKWAYTLSRHYGYELFMGLLVIFNVVIFIAEVDARATCEYESVSCTPQWASRSSNVLLFAYTIDVALRLFAEREWYHHDLSNLLELFVVVCGYVELGIALFDPENAESQLLLYLRLLRLLRVMRAVNFSKSFPFLHKLIVSFFGTMRALFWGLIMIMIMILLWAIIIVDMMGPIRNKDSDEFCSVVFSGVAYNMLYLFQTIIAGDSWGQCIIPIVWEHWHMFLPFAFALVSLVLGVTNVILAVIVDASVEAREESNHERMQSAQKRTEQNVTGLYKLMKEIDADKSGTISESELMDSYDHVPEMSRRLMELGIDKPDLTKLYHFMADQAVFERADAEDESNESPEVVYADLIDTLLQAGKQDHGRSFMLLTLQTRQIEYRLSALMEAVQHIASDVPIRGCSKGSSGVTAAAGGKTTREPPEVLATTPESTPAVVLTNCHTTEEPPEVINTTTPEQCNVKSGLRQPERIASSLQNLDLDMVRFPELEFGDLVGKLKELSNHAERQAATLADRASNLKLCLSARGQAFQDGNGQLEVSVSALPQQVSTNSRSTTEGSPTHDQEQFQLLSNDPAPTYQGPAVQLSRV